MSTLSWCARGATLLSLCLTVLARHHALHLNRDTRRTVMIESFGFQAGGSMALTLHSASATPTIAEHVMGFVVLSSYSDSMAAETVGEYDRLGLCMLDDLALQTLNVTLTAPEAPTPAILPYVQACHTAATAVHAACAVWMSGVWLLVSVSSSRAVHARTCRQPMTYSYTFNKGGLYTLILTHCAPSTRDATMSVSLDYTFVNPGGNYLSAGEIPLPWVFGAVTMCYGIVIVLWLRHIREQAKEVCVPPHAARSSHVLIRLLCRCGRGDVGAEWCRCCGHARARTRTTRLVCCAAHCANLGAVHAAEPCSKIAPPHDATRGVQALVPHV
ncbi:hypothetical protein EON66_07340 [archaeon]|nr:MAG: hypothetical protein EON66_07340 [archaeon]